MAEKLEKGDCKCPYCDGPIDKSLPFCTPCQKEFKLCEGCGKPIPRDAEYCPYCNPED